MAHHHEAGKGDNRRTESKEKFDNGYDLIWGNKKKPPEEKKPEPKK
jgi:hypothetical protein